MYTTRVTIVTPIYNAASYLDKYFDSLLNQTLKEIEIICVNNASTDKSLEILQKFAANDNRITVINNKENNIGGAINQAIKIAKSIYICPIDQDDWVDVNMFKTLIDYSENETADMVCSDYYEYFNENDVREIINIPNKIANSTEDIKKHVLINGARIFTNLIKKDLFINNNLFYPENVFYPDNAIGSALYCMAKKIVKVNEYFYYYNTGNVSLTRSTNNFNFFDRLTTSNTMLENMKRLGLYENYKEEVDYSYYKLFYKNSITGSFSRFTQFPVKYINQIKSEFKLKDMNINNNIYFKKRHITYEDFILLCIYINTNLGFVIFGVYKFVIHLRNFIYKSK